MKAEPKIEILAGELARLDLKPGDKAVLMVPEPLHPEQVAAIRKAWEAAFTGPAPMLLVLDSGVRLGVLRVEADCPS